MHPPRIGRLTGKWCQRLPEGRSVAKPSPSHPQLRRVSIWCRMRIRRLPCWVLREYLEETYKHPNEQIWPNNPRHTLWQLYSSARGARRLINSYLPGKHCAHWVRGKRRRELVRSRPHTWPGHDRRREEFQVQRWEPNRLAGRWKHIYRRGRSRRRNGGGEKVFLFSNWQQLWGWQIKRNFKQTDAFDATSVLTNRASTLAFSIMESWDGLPFPIFKTHLHLAKSAPSFLYSLQRSARPSSPWVVHSSSVPANGTTPLSTLMPT